MPVSVLCEAERDVCCHYPFSIFRADSLLATSEAETLVPHLVHSLLVIDSRQWADIVGFLLTTDLLLSVVNHKGSGPDREIVSLNPHLAQPTQL